MKLTLKNDPEYGLLLADAKSGETIENVAKMTAILDARTRGLVEIEVTLYIKAGEIIDKNGEIVHEI